MRHSTNCHQFGRLQKDAETIQDDVYVVDRTETNVVACELNGEAETIIRLFYWW